MIDQVFRALLAPSPRAEQAGLVPASGFLSLLSETFAVIGVGVRFAKATPESAQMDLL